mmetsp:Transcript_38697/g.109412  ORF Transcript_38697/g.109412 Transcript_38697/m.109412 type:complete len:281 (+) Transcript_38697:230-1072(+)
MRGPPVPALGGQGTLRFSGANLGCGSPPEGSRRGRVPGAAAAPQRPSSGGPRGPRRRRRGQRPGPRGRGPPALAATGAGAVHRAVAHGGVREKVAGLGARARRHAAGPPRPPLGRCSLVATLAGALGLGLGLADAVDVAAAAAAVLSAGLRGPGAGRFRRWRRHVGRRQLRGGRLGYVPRQRLRGLAASAGPGARPGPGGGQAAAVLAVGRGGARARARGRRGGAGGGVLGGAGGGGAGQRATSGDGHPGPIARCPLRRLPPAGARHDRGPKLGGASEAP